ncbi:MAG TPA: hypothetical protein PK916_02115 [Bacteroidota bacterium]|nr:hypothetical protein [Bacteroidota bacterium]
MRLKDVEKQTRNCRNPTGGNFGIFTSRCNMTTWRAAKSAKRAEIPPPATMGERLRPESGFADRGCSTPGNMQFAPSRRLVPGAAPPGRIFWLSLFSSAYAGCGTWRERRGVIRIRKEETLAFLPELQ